MAGRLLFEVNNTNIFLFGLHFFCILGKSVSTECLFLLAINQFISNLFVNCLFHWQGGYCLKSFAECVALTLRCLLGDPCPDVGPLQAPVDQYVI